jgi:hypothetical protein
VKFFRAPSGGDYLYFNGTSLPYLSRLKPDGTVDASFNLGVVLMEKCIVH